MADVQLPSLPARIKLFTISRHPDGTVPRMKSRRQIGFCLSWTGTQKHNTAAAESPGRYFEPAQPTRGRGCDVGQKTPQLESVIEGTTRHLQAVAFRGTNLQTMCSKQASHSADPSPWHIALALVMPLVSVAPAAVVGLEGKHVAASAHVGLLFVWGLRLRLDADKQRMSVAHP